MKESILKQLTAIQLLVRGLTDEEYIQKQDILSGASVGQHVRHILEFYICLTKGRTSGELCYDNRKRDNRIEIHRTFADHLIDSLKDDISSFIHDRLLKLRVNFSFEGHNTEYLNTTLNREVAYNLEHGIHHQALIKIGVKKLKRDDLLDETFGVAPATIRHQKQHVVPTN